ncbi:MAG: hypothetical protein WD556_02635 [Actinomycetota bacterium]
MSEIPLEATKFRCTNCQEMVVVPPGPPSIAKPSTADRLQSTGKKLDNAGKAVSSFVWSVFAVIFVVAMFYACSGPDS